MKNIAAIIITALFAGCATVPGGKAEVFEAAPSRIDQRIDTASIEDYILALPPFAFHEETVAQFAERVRGARASEKENAGMDRDSLFVRGDGSAPSKKFVLDRSLRTLTITSMNWEPGMTHDIVAMRRVQGGWMRGPRIDIKSAEQVVAPNRSRR